MWQQRHAFFDGDDAAADEEATMAQQFPLD
jgi:hypothetical protein